MMKLVKVLFFPCAGQRGFRTSGHSYSADEWYETDDGKDRERKSSVAHYTSLEVAEARYAPLLGQLRRADWRKDLDDYVTVGCGVVQDANFIVTNSHAFCPECRAYMRELSITMRMQERHISREESEAIQSRIEGEVDEMLTKASKK